MELSLPSLTRPRGARARTTNGVDASWRARVRTLLPSSSLALRGALCALLLVALLGGGWLWLRGSSLVAVRHVHISGVHGPDALEIRAALDASAKNMTTMDFETGQLRAAVSSYALVGALRVSTSFPHTVHIYVTERPPVAVLLAAGQRTAVAADGTVLGAALASGSLPQLAGSFAPRTGARLHEASALAGVAVLGAAPRALVPYVQRVYEGHEGLTVAMSTGLLVYFGDAARPHAKWLSLARVLASPGSAGATYVDVRLPERPAAGLSSSASSASSSNTASSAQNTSTTEQTTAALAASLSNAVGGSSTAPVSGSEPSSSTESEASSTENEASTTESQASSETESGGSAPTGEATPQG
jgi:cell division protein FtsQ